MTEQPSRPVRTRVTLTGISSRALEHPADRGALVALRKLKGFDAVLKAGSGLFKEPAVRLLHLGSAARVDERQSPTLHYLLLDVGPVLDVEDLLELYVTAELVFFEGTWFAYYGQSDSTLGVATYRVGDDYSELVP